MNHNEKAEFLKDSIRELYSIEGRSFSAIEKILKINRKVISEKIKEWGFEPAHKYHFKPSIEKHLNRERQKIASMLLSGETITKIAEETNFSRKTLTSVILIQDKHLNECYNKWKEKFSESKAEKMEDSRLNYESVFSEDEEWRPILGFGKYQASSLGRIRRYSKTYRSYYLLSPVESTTTKRLYIPLVGDNGKTKNLILARVIAQTFIPHPEEKNAVNHIDGNLSNNKVENLEWVTRSENDKHAYKILNRAVVDKRKFIFSKIIYNGTYEFSTVSAFARFLNKSETQTRRYLEDPSKYDMDIRFI